MENPYESPHTPIHSDMVCPHCGSTDTVSLKVKGVFKKLIHFLSYISIWHLLDLLRKKHPRKCNECGKTINEVKFSLILFVESIIVLAGLLWILLLLSYYMSIT